MDIEVCPIQLPGRENRFTEPPFSSLSLLVEALCEGLLAYLDMPYAFFGHSMGALISFELARTLRRSKRVSGPLQLFVSGHRAPHLPDLRPPVHQLPESQMIEALRHFNGTPKDVLKHTELLQVLLPRLRADFGLCETYHYALQPPLSCPITAFGGLQDQYVSPASILAWREHTSSTFNAHFFTGDHFFFYGEYTRLLTIISQQLALISQRDVLV